VINIVKFYEVYCDVEPKRRALEEANAELAAAQDKLAAVKAKVWSQFHALFYHEHSSVF
jgi:dynein heavy chain